MDTPEDRQQYVESVLDHLANEFEEEENRPNAADAPNELPDHQEGMPEHLSTPVNVKQVEQKKKKKRKKKSKSAGLPEAGSDMPEDYQEKYSEDVMENPYDPSNPLSQRVEYAIWKYRKNHKFSESKKNIFDHYLRFGGIRTGPNAFQGRTTGADAPDDPEAEQDWEAAKTSTDVVPDLDPDDEDVYVSFTEVAQVYLGNRFFREGRFIGTQDFVDAPALVDAFLRYLEIRNVCPEYKEDIAQARVIANLAKDQLPKCKRLAMSMPGSFNKACSLLFEGELKTASMEDMSWLTSTAQKQLMESALKSVIGMTEDGARDIVSPVIKNPSKRTVVDNKTGLMVRVHKITHDPDCPLTRVCLTDFETSQQMFDLFFETDITNDLVEGMVMTVTLYRLDSGQWYLDKASLIMPTFYIEDECADQNLYFFD